MDNVINNKEIFRSIIERDAGNIYSNIKTQVLNMIPIQFKPFAMNYIKANQDQWIKVLQEKCDMLVETSFINPETTLEEAINNAQTLINNIVNKFLSDKIGIPMNTINIATQVLFGVHT